MTEIFGQVGSGALPVRELLGASLSFGCGEVSARAIEGGRIFWRPGGSGEIARPTTVVMGAFDGFHQGHQELVRAALREASARGIPCMALTFDPDPSEVVDQIPAEDHLLEVSDRIRALLGAGVDAVVALDFTRQLAGCAPDDFVKTTLVDLLGAVSVHVGSDFRFGRGGEGDVGTLKRAGAAQGFAVCPFGLVRHGDEVVSATHVRRVLTVPGAIDEVSELLGRWHFVRGLVERGRGEGTSFGFPTANVRCAQHVAFPAEGVYGGFVRVGDRAWTSAINVGAPVSFSGPEERFLEANLIGFSGDLYGSVVEVVFACWLRPPRRFDSIAELEETVLSNIDWVREHLGDGPAEVPS